MFVVLQRLKLLRFMATPVPQLQHLGAMLESVDTFDDGCTIHFSAFKSIQQYNFRFSVCVGVVAGGDGSARRRSSDEGQDRDRDDRTAQTQPETVDPDLVAKVCVCMHAEFHMCAGARRA